jgi:hypothetical protein
MKVHDNTSIGGVGVVLWASANICKSKGLIELAGYQIGLAHFQKHVSPSVFQEGYEELPADAFASAPGGDCEIEDFDFVRRGAPDREKPGHLALELRDRDLVTARVPRRRLRTGALNRGDRGVILGAGGADHYFLGA